MFTSEMVLAQDSGTDSGDENVVTCYSTYIQRHLGNGGVKYYTYQGEGCVKYTETATFEGVMTYCGDGSNWTCSERCVGEGESSS